MAKQKPLFPIRGVIALRPDGRGPCGFHNHVEFFTDRISAAEYCDGAELVECVITDCRWRDRPTCAGLYIDSENEWFVFNQLVIDEWDCSEVYNGEGPWFGPIPNPPEVSE